MLHKTLPVHQLVREQHNVGIMQPYVFPYIGYFNLIEACDTFVFYDDVNFIKKGWVNRNRVLANGHELRFTIPLVNASQNHLICDIQLHDFDKFKVEFIKSIENFYSRSPYFILGMEYVKNTLCQGHVSIADVAVASVKEFYALLGIEKKFLLSSLSFPETRGMGKGERLIEITRRLNAKTYVNAMGGVSLYSKDVFKAEGLLLDFINPQIASYSQKKAKQFMPGLSIIDILMNSSVSEIKKMLNSYERV